MFDTQISKPRVILAAVDTGEYDMDSAIEELSELAKTAGAEIAAALVQKRPTIDNATVLGAGRLEDLAQLCETEQADQVIFDCELSASQIRNIQKAVKTDVIDRTMLILDIFAQRATTSEGRLQVELAQYKYRLPRLAGLGGELSRQGAGIGTRGPGETKLETDRRYIRQRIHVLSEQLKDIEQRRSLSRVRRKKDDVKVCAIVGYTNAGKSTLLNALTDAGVLAEDKLFATLETTSRAVKLPDENETEIIMVDTVGLISRLPHHLVEAFKSTLEEAANADVIIHLCDISDSECKQKAKVTLDLLNELGCEGIPVVTVFSKCDLSDESFDELSSDVVCISAKTGEGIDNMLKAVAQALPDNTFSGKFLFPFEQGSLLAKVRTLGKIHSESYTPDGTVCDITIEKRYLHLLKDIKTV